MALKRKKINKRESDKKETLLPDGSIDLYRMALSLI